MGLDQPYQPNDPWELEGSFNHSTARDLAITSDARKGSVAKTVAKIPPVLSGMDKAEALAFVSRLFDAAQAGAVLWGDELLLKRFLEQCSRTGSQETIDGYARELRHFVRWHNSSQIHCSVVGGVELGAPRHMGPPSRITGSAGNRVLSGYGLGIAVSARGVAHPLGRAWR